MTLNEETKSKISVYSNWKISTPNTYIYIYIYIYIAHSAGAAEYTDCISVEG